MNDVQPTISNLGAVIIAAGNSSRLGQAKQLIKFNGESLLRNTLKLAESTSEKYICILGSNADSIEKQLDLESDRIMTNQNWQVGMGSSIALGVETLSVQAGKDPIDAILVLLCDQYLLTAGDIRKLVSQWQLSKNKLTASQYFDKKNDNWVLGAPAIFPRRYFDELMNLSDKGARKILNRERNNLNVVDIENASIDLDTPEDLLLLTATNKKNLENNND